MKKKKLAKKFPKKAAKPVKNGKMGPSRSPQDEVDDLASLIDHAPSGMGSAAKKFPGIVGKKPGPFGKKASASNYGFGH